MNDPEAESDGLTFCDVLNTDFNRVTLMDEQQETSIFDKTFSSSVLYVDLLVFLNSSAFGSSS